MLNRISIMGRITKDLELKTTQSGNAVVSFGIATDRNYKEGNDYPTDFFDVVAWKKTAEFVNKYFKKGQLIAIDGTLQTRTFKDKNNVDRKVVEILVDGAYFCEKKEDNRNAKPATTNTTAYNNQQNAYSQPVQNNDYPFNDGEFDNDFMPEF